MSKTKKIPTLDYGEIDDVMQLLHAQMLIHGPMAKLKFLSGEITTSELKCHQGHHKYYSSLFRKTATILNAHKK